MHRRLLTFTSLALLACGSEIVQSSSGSSSGSGAASSTTSSGSHTSSTTSSASAGSAAGGASGGTGGGFVTSSTSSTGPGSGGGLPTCDKGWIEIQGDGPNQHYAFSCPDTWGSMDSPTPYAYVSHGGGFVGVLDLQGCSTGMSGAGSLEVQAIFNPGPDAMAGNVTYADPSGAMWTNAPNTAFFIQITNEAMNVGDYYDGAFKLEVTRPNQPNKILGGSFHLCRTPDFAAP